MGASARITKALNHGQGSFLFIGMLSGITSLFLSISASPIALLVTVPLLFSSTVSGNQINTLQYVPPQNFDPSHPYTQQRKFIVQIIAAACSAVSMTSAFLAFYWFLRMEKRFRHRLIMLLIYGDLMRGAWFFIFAIVSLKSGTVQTGSAFCQGSGFFIQYGNETSDFAVLTIALHSALQALRPSHSARSNGLYPYRHIVYMGAFIIPALMAGLAFVNSHPGYMSQGAFCSLPLRPFWYRLALAWIPRYLIAVVILGLAIAIYTHVGFEFQRFDRLSGELSVSTEDPIPQLENRDLENGHAVEPTDQQNSVKSQPQSCLIDDGTNIRASTRTSHTSNVASVVSGSQPQPDPQSRSLISSHTLSEANISHNHRSKPQSSMPGPSRKGTDSTKTSHETSGPPSPRSKPPPHAQHGLKAQRASINRQLRLMFVYPIAYLLMWIFPFVYHCMQYKDEYAQHPIYALTILATVSITLMGTVDCLIFNLRERPWRHIANSDGTFWGSFKLQSKYIRKFSSVRASVDDKQEGAGRGVGSTTRNSAGSHNFNPGCMDGLPRVRQVRTSKSSDHEMAAAERAYERLKYEQQDRREANVNRPKYDRRRSRGLSLIGRMGSVADRRGIEMSSSGESGESGKSGGVEEKADEENKKETACGGQQ